MDFLQGTLHLGIDGVLGFEAQDGLSLPLIGNLDAQRLRLLGPGRTETTGHFVRPCRQRHHQPWPLQPALQHQGARTKANDPQFHVRQNGSGGFRNRGHPEAIVLSLCVHRHAVPRRHATGEQRFAGIRLGANRRHRRLWRTLPQTAASASACALSEALSNRFRVVAVDLHSCGRTAAWSRPRPLGLDDEVALLAPVWHRAGPWFHIVGHACGGAVALMAALRHAERVADSPASGSTVQSHAAPPV